MSARRLVAVTMMVFALGFAPASAAVVRLSDDPTAQHPDVAVDGKGTLHVVWQRRVAATGDEDVVYCRIPRGASACAQTRSFGLLGAGEPPRVVLMATGEVVIVSERFKDDPARLSPDNKAYAITSADGGVTFGAPHVIANRAGTIYGWGGEVEPGPGNFSVSLVGGGYGACSEGPVYTAAPIDGFTDRWASLASTCGFGASVAFVDPVTPLVAYTDSNRIYYRRWGGSGSQNDVSTWLPVQVAPFSGSDPRLAGGPRGVYLMYADAKPPYDYWVSRFDSQSDKFVGPVMVSANDGKSAIFRDFFEDAGGALHAVFIENSQLRQAVSVPGEGWRPPVALAQDNHAGVEFFNLRVGAAPDGGGAVVADHNGKGPIYFVPFAPTGGSAGCPATVMLGQAFVHAVVGCFKKQKNGTRVTTGPVRINGIDVEPLANGARAAAGFAVTVDEKARTLMSSATASVRAGNIVLDRGKVFWKLPQGTGVVERLGSPDPSVFKDIGKYTKELFGFPVRGDAELLVGKDETARIPTHLKLPDLIGGVSGDVTLDTTGAGLDLHNLTLSAPDAGIGLLRISKISVTYDGADRFTGSAQLQLPVAFNPTFKVGFGFQDGRLSFLHYEAPFNPMLPIVGSPPQPLVGLESLAIDYVNKLGSREFAGAVQIVGGGKYFGLRAAALDGKVVLDFPATGPATIAATGALSVVNLPFATGEVNYSTAGTLKFNGSYEFPPQGKWQSLAKVEGSVDGWISLAPPLRFSATGSASASIGPFGGSGKSVISSTGVSACVSFPAIPPFGHVLPDLGISYKWGDAFPVPVCNVGTFTLSPTAAKMAAGETGVQIPSGLPQAAIEIDGAGSAPRVTVTAPDGGKITSGSGTVVAGRFIATEFAEAHKTYVMIGKPPAGGYAIAPAGGSAPITGVRLARGLPDPKVTATVHGSGRKRTLNYRFRSIPGQQITFAEESLGGLYHELAKVKASRGTLVFRPADSQQRKRKLIALIEQDGVPRARLDVATFTASSPAPLAKPKVMATRSGHRLVIRWNRIDRAEGYRVTVKLPKDGRRLLRFLGPRQRELRISGLEPNDTATVTVQAIGNAAQPGRAGSARLKALKRR